MDFVMNAIDKYLRFHHSNLLLARILVGSRPAQIVIDLTSRIVEMSFKKALR